MVRECSAFCFGRVTPRGGTRTLGSCATVLVVCTISVVASLMRLRCWIASGMHCGCEIRTRSRVKEGGLSCDDTVSVQDVEANVAIENPLPAEDRGSVFSEDLESVAEVQEEDSPVEDITHSRVPH